MKFKLISTAPIENTGVEVKSISDGTVIVEAIELPEALTRWILGIDKDMPAKKPYARMSIDNIRRAQ